MRICLVADFGELDEARKVIAHNLCKGLSQTHEVLKADIRNLAFFKFWSRVREFEPDIIHYIPGASPISFALTRTLQVFTRKPKTVISATLHSFDAPFRGAYYLLSFLTAWAIPLVQADLVIVQSEEALTRFKKLGCNVRFAVCSGVDVKRFAPISDRRKQELRRKYGISETEFVALHVGSIRKWRNIQILSRFQSGIPGIQTIAIGRVSTKIEGRVLVELKRAGCKVITEYVPNIEEIYALSDCYVFPTTDRLGSIDIPLSVLEAMSCNLPIVTIKFGALPSMFVNSDGLFFVEREDEILKAVDAIKNGNIEIRTREKVLPYSWESITKKLELIYAELLH